MSVSRRSAEKEAFWRLVVDEQKASGLSVRAFCKRESVSEPSFYAWRKELEKRDRIQENKSDQLIPVSVVHRNVPSSPTSSLEVETPSGFKIRFDQHLETSRLRDLLLAITFCCRDDDGHHDDSSQVVRGGSSC